MKRSPWFSPAWRPQFVGVVECCLNPELPYIFYRHWDMHRFGRPALDVEEARKNLQEDHALIGLYWRARLTDWLEPHDVPPMDAGVFETEKGYQLYDKRTWFEAKPTPQQAASLLLLFPGTTPRVYRGIYPW